jgi:uncharacterized membrane protein YqiK
MNLEHLLPFIGLAFALVVLGFGLLTIVGRFYRQVEQGRALVINTLSSEPHVTFTGAVVYPVINRAEVMDLSVKTIEIDRRGKEGLICNDNIRADINVTFFVRVNKTQDDVLKVAQSIGCARASNPETIKELFTAKFSEALKTVGKHFNFEELYTKRDEFKDKIIEVIGKDLNGFILDDAAIDFLEQTQLEALDRDNIMDADGIRKITELTVTQNVRTNELRQKERMEMGSQNLAADEAIFRFDQRRAEAEAKKMKEIAVAQSREENEAMRVASDEKKKTQLVYEKNEEESLVAAENKARGAAIAQKAREREIAIETERVEKARQLEMIGREREVALVGIARDKEVEVQKKEIADVVRSRIVVEKTVATEEEAIKDVRALAQASRERDVVRIGAESAAQEQLVRQVKAAEAAEEVAKHGARTRMITADAELETADKMARSKIRIAEGVQAEIAAPGIAEVRVKEADAAALEKRGLVEARVTLEKLQAEAAGEEKQGLARVKVKQADAEATQKVGLAEAAVVREKLLAEASGIAEKAAAMKALDESSRGHEEFRLRLEKDKTVELEALRQRREMAQAQAQVLAQAFGAAKINIVGGDGRFFDRFVNAVSMGQAVEGALGQSDTLKTLLKGGDSDGGLIGALERVLGGDDETRAQLLGLLEGEGRSETNNRTPPRQR